MNLAEPRIVVASRNLTPSVPCEPRDGSASCGAMTTFRIKAPCENCGKVQARQHAPEPPPEAEVHDGNVLVVDADTGAVVAGQLVVVEEICSRLIDAINSIPKNYWEGHPGNRLSGIVNSNLTFGTSAPAALRRRWGCQSSGFDRDHGHITEMIVEALGIGLAMLELHAPLAHKVTVEAATEAIPALWRLRDLPWTSGVINRTSALPYHRDSGNLKETWSAMLGARRDIEGGHLHLADYDVWLGIPHGSVCIFDGQSVLHGVSPIHPVSRRAIRYTIVAYAKAAIRNCCDNHQDEVLRAKKKATESAERIARDGIAPAPRKAAS